MVIIVNCGSSKTPEFVSRLGSLGYENSIVPMAELNEVQWDNVKGLIISGAPILLTDEDPKKYLERFEFILNLDIPILGVCFGHQILGMLNGAEIKRGTEDRDWQAIRKTEESTLFNGIPNPGRFMQDHCEEISLPEGFKHTATSDACAIEGMQHNKKEWFGVQFHPEVSGYHGRRLLNNFCRLCK